MTDSENQTAGRSPTVRFRAPEDMQRPWKEFCDQKKITLSYFLKKCANTIINNPELWDNPFPTKRELSQLQEKIAVELTEIKQLVIRQNEVQNRQIDELKIELGHLAREDPIREVEYVKGVLKERLHAILKPKGMKLNEIREKIPDPSLQAYLFPPSGKALSLLDRALTELVKEGYAKVSNNRYSSSDLDLDLDSL